MENFGAISGFAGGLSAGGLVAIFIVLCRTYLQRFRLGTEARVADDGISGNQWTRFQREISRLDERVDELSREVEECRKREAEGFAREQEWISRAIRAEAEVSRLQALDLGRGQANQEVQRRLSADRMEEKRDKGGNGQ